MQLLTKKPYSLTQGDQIFVQAAAVNGKGQSDFS